MNAIQNSFSPPQPIQERPHTSRRKRNLRQRYCRVMAMEMSLKIGVNLIIATVTLCSLARLLPYHWSQQEKLREIRTEEKLMKENVDNLTVDFSRNFDPHQRKTIMQEQGYRFSPNQLRVVWSKYPQEKHQ